MKNTKESSPEAFTALQRGCSVQVLLRGDEATPHPYSQHSLDTRCKRLLEKHCPKHHPSMNGNEGECFDVFAAMTSNKQLRDALLAVKSKRIVNLVRDKSSAVTTVGDGDDNLGHDSSESAKTVDSGGDTMVRSSIDGDVAANMVDRKKYEELASTLYESEHLMRLYTPEAPSNKPLAPAAISASVGSLSALYLCVFISLSISALLFTKRKQHPRRGSKQSSPSSILTLKGFKEMILQIIEFMYTLCVEIFTWFRAVFVLVFETIWVIASELWIQGGLWSRSGSKSKDKLREKEHSKYKNGPPSLKEKSSSSMSTSSKLSNTVNRSTSSVSTGSASSSNKKHDNKGGNAKDKSSLTSTKQLKSMSSTVSSISMCSESSMNKEQDNTVGPLNVSLSGSTDDELESEKKDIEVTIPFIEENLKPYPPIEKEEDSCPMESGNSPVLKTKPCVRVQAEGNHDKIIDVVVSDADNIEIVANNIQIPVIADSIQQTNGAGAGAVELDNAKNSSVSSAIAGTSGNMDGQERQETSSPAIPLVADSQEDVWQRNQRVVGRENWNSKRQINSNTVGKNATLWPRGDFKLFSPTANEKSNSAGTFGHPTIRLASTLRDDEFVSTPSSSTSWMGIDGQVHNEMNSQLNDAAQLGASGFANDLHLYKYWGGSTVSVTSGDESTQYSAMDKANHNRPGYEIATEFDRPLVTPFRDSSPSLSDHSSLFPSSVARKPFSPPKKTETEKSPTLKLSPTILSTVSFNEHHSISTGLSGISRTFSDDADAEYEPPADCVLLDPIGEKSDRSAGTLPIAPALFDSLDDTRPSTSPLPDVSLVGKIPTKCLSHKPVPPGFESSPEIDSRGTDGRPPIDPNVHVCNTLSEHISQNPKAGNAGGIKGHKISNRKRGTRNTQSEQKKATFRSGSDATAASTDTIVLQVIGLSDP